VYPHETTNCGEKISPSPASAAQRNETIATLLPRSGRNLASKVEHLSIVSCS
jgi:hypothetical protein